MGMLMSGTCLGVTREQRGQGDKRRSYTTIHLLDGVDKHELDVPEVYEGNLPGAGEQCVFDVEASAWAGNGAARLFLRALRRNEFAEKAIFATD